MAFLQGVSGTTNIAGNTCAFTTQNTAPGSLLVALFNDNPQTSVLNSVSDNQGGNTWVVLPVITNGSTYNIYLAYALNTTGGSKPTITPHWSATPSFTAFALGEYSGVNTFRGASTVAAPGGSATITTNAVTTAVGDLVLAYMGSNTNMASAPTGTGTTVEESGGFSSIFLNAFGDAIATGTSSTATFNKPVSAAATIALAFYNNTPTPTGAWSPIDSRQAVHGFGPGPNNFRVVQGSDIYDVQISSNSAVPGVDSRVVVPTDCRIAPNIPQNSRAPEV